MYSFLVLAALYLTILPVIAIPAWVNAYRWAVSSDGIRFLMSNAHYRQIRVAAIALVITHAPLVLVLGLSDVLRGLFGLWEIDRLAAVVFYVTEATVLLTMVLMSFQLVCFRRRRAQQADALALVSLRPRPRSLTPSGAASRFRSTGSAGSSQY